MANEIHDVCQYSMGQAEIGNECITAAMIYGDQQKGRLFLDVLVCTKFAREAQTTDEAAIRRTGPKCVTECGH